MDANTQVMQRCFVEASPDSQDAATPIDPRADYDISHSEDNILKWMSFLPEDCIRTMIAMGWDVST